MRSIIKKLIEEDKIRCFWDIVGSIRKRDLQNIPERSRSGRSIRKSGKNWQVIEEENLCEDRNDWGLVRFEAVTAVVE